MTFVQAYRERTAAANQARQQGTCRKLERIEATLRTMRRDGTRWRSVERAQSPPREKYGRGLSVVSQDNIRRVVLREHDRPGAAFPVK
jgi:hypothetical protein